MFLFLFSAATSTQFWLYYMLHTNTCFISTHNKTLIKTQTQQNFLEASLTLGCLLIPKNQTIKWWKFYVTGVFRPELQTSISVMKKKKDSWLPPSFHPSLLRGTMCCGETEQDTTTRAVESTQSSRKLWLASDQSVIKKFLHQKSFLRGSNKNSYNNLNKKMNLKSIFEINKSTTK